MVTVTVHPVAAGTEVDENGDDIAIAAEPYELEVLSVYPMTSSEPGDPNRASVITGKTILAPEGTILSPHDRIDVDQDGTLWEIVGEIATWDRRASVVRNRGFTIAGGMPFVQIREGSVQINVERVNG